jgi:hypothetical protein
MFSEREKNISEYAKSISEHRKNLSEHEKNISEHEKNISEYEKNISECAKNLSERAKKFSGVVKIIFAVLFSAPPIYSQNNLCDFFPQKLFRKSVLNSKWKLSANSLNSSQISHFSLNN